MEATKTYNFQAGELWVEKSVDSKFPYKAYYLVLDPKFGIDKTIQIYLLHTGEITEIYNHFYVDSPFNMEKIS